MSPRNVIRVGLLACALALPGCKKQPPSQPPFVESGVEVDGPRLQVAFSGSALEIQNLVNDFIRDLRYGLYVNSLQALDKLAANPSLTDPQKKVVAEVIEQVKQVIAKAGPKR
jgi:hypothetical protein